MRPRGARSQYPPPPPPHRFGPPRGGHPRQPHRYYEDVDNDRYTEDEEVDHFRSDHPPLDRSNQPRPLLDLPDRVSPRPLFDTHCGDYSDHQAVNNAPQQFTDSYNQQNNAAKQPEVQPKSLSATPTNQQQPFVHPLLARAKEKRMREMANDPSKQTAPVKSEELSRTPFVHPLLARAAAAAAAATDHQGDTDQQPVKCETNDTLTFTPRQVRVNQPPVIKTESDDIDAELYQSFEVKQEAEEDTKSECVGGWKPVLSSGDDKMAHSATTKKETEIPGLELSSKKSVTPDAANQTAGNEWKQQDDVPQVVKTVEVISEPFLVVGQATPAAAVAKTEGQAMIMETKGQYSFSSRPPEQQEEKQIEQAESTVKPKKKSKRQVAGKDFLLGKWERVNPNKQQTESQDDTPKDGPPPEEDTAEGDFPQQKATKEDNPPDRHPAPGKEFPPETHTPDHSAPSRPLPPEWPPHQPPHDSNFPSERWRPPRRDFPPDRRPSEAEYKRFPEQDLPRRRPPEWDYPPNRRLPLERAFPPDRRLPPERDFPPDRRLPPERDFPPDRRLPPERDFPTDRRLPPERDFPPDRRLPPERDYPPDRRLPPERDFPPDRRLPPERDFPPDRRLPPERDFPPDRRLPPERNFPPDRRLPPERDFLPARRPPEWDFPPDRRLHDRDYIPERMSPGNFPPNRQPPDRKFPPDHRPEDFPQHQRPLERDLPPHRRPPPERDYLPDQRPSDRRPLPDRDFPLKRRLPENRDFPSERQHDGHVSAFDRLGYNPRDQGNDNIGT